MTQSGRDHSFQFQLRLCGSYADAVGAKAILGDRQRASYSGVRGDLGSLLSSTACESNTLSRGG